MDLPDLDKDEEDDLFGSDDDPVDEPTADAIPIDDSDKAAVVVTSKRQVLPSSMGLSVLVPRPCQSVQVTVRWGDYRAEYGKGDDNAGSESEEEAFALDATASNVTARKRRKITA